MNRWCIISNARSGSTWLEHGIYNKLISTDPSAEILGEFFIYERSRQNKIILDLNKNLKRMHGVLWPLSNKIELYNRLKDYIKQNNKNQSLTTRIFIQEQEFPKAIYRDFLKHLLYNNFYFINLERNIIDRVISAQVAFESNRWARWVKYGEVTTVLLDNKEYKDITELDIESCIKWYKITQEQDNIRYEILTEIPHITIHYENARDMLLKKHIPFIEPNDIIKTYDESYQNKIKNYNEIIQELEKCK